jgi:hypothetical protein
MAHSSHILVVALICAAAFLWLEIGLYVLQ